MSKKINQHYIPQFYLERFTDSSRKFCVYNINKDSFLLNQTPRNFAAQRFFYDTSNEKIAEYVKPIIKLYPELENNEILKDEQFIENYLNRVEGDIKTIFDTLDNDPSKLQDEVVQIKLGIFLFDLQVRTEARRNMFKYINGEIYNFLDNSLPDNLKHLKEKYNPNNSKDLQLSSFFDLNGFADIILNLKLHYSWNIGINESKLDLILSDNPAMDIFLGFNDICIPISPKKAIIFRTNTNGKILSDDYPNNNIINLSQRSVFIYNVLQRVHGRRYVFGDYSSIAFVRAIGKLSRDFPPPNF